MGEAEPGPSVSLGQTGYLLFVRFYSFFGGAGSKKVCTLASVDMKVVIQSGFNTV